MNRVIEEMLRNYVAADQPKWEEEMPMIEFAYNNSSHSSTGATPFLLNNGRHPCDPLTRALGGEATHAPAAEDFVGRIQRALKLAQRNMAAAQEQQRHYANKRRRELTLQRGDKVYLSAANLHWPGEVWTCKLCPKRVGPFAVRNAVGAVAYELELPADWTRKGMHPVFHVSLLTPAVSSECFGEREPERPAPMFAADGEEEFEVEELLDHRPKRGTIREYLVSWKGYPIEDRMWVPVRNLHCPQLVKEYLRRVHRAAQA